MDSPEGAVSRYKITVNDLSRTYSINVRPDHSVKLWYAYFQDFAVSHRVGKHWGVTKEEAVKKLLDEVRNIDPLAVIEKI